jgi:hypothetical protein
MGTKFANHRVFQALFALAITSCRALARPCQADIDIERRWTHATPLNSGARWRLSLPALLVGGAGAALVIGVALGFDDAQAPPNNAGYSPVDTAKPRLNLSIPEPPDTALFLSIAERWSATADELLAAQLAISRWADAERRAIDGEFREIERMAEELCEALPASQRGGSPPGDIDLFETAIQRRNRAVERRIERENNLIRSLAGMCGRSSADDEVKAVQARLVSLRVTQMPSLFQGARFDLGAFMLARAGRDSPVYDEIESTARRYWIAMEPVLRERYRAHCAELDDAARDARERGSITCAAGPRPRRAAVESTKRAILASEAWIATFVSVSMRNETCVARMRACRDIQRVASGQPSDSLSGCLDGSPCSQDCEVDTVQSRICAQWLQLDEAVWHAARMSRIDAMEVRICGPRRSAPPGYAAIEGSHDEMLARIAAVHSIALESSQASAAAAAGSTDEPIAESDNSPARE